MPREDVGIIMFHCIYHNGSLNSFSALQSHTKTIW